MRITMKMRLGSVPGRVAGILLALLVCLAVEPAWSQSPSRILPANGQRAMLTGYSDRVVAFGREQRRLAPGAVIYDTNNRTILPGFLPQEADVVYTTDNTGAVLRIYLLTPQEQQRLDQAKR
jgi:hypothetical protein